MEATTSMDDENGNCVQCRHPFNPHIVIAFDVDDFSKGGEVRCHINGCDCVWTASFNLEPEKV
jgi:hypothetical protein